MKAKGKLKLVFPTKEYKEQIEEYLKEHFDNGEFDLTGDGGLDKIQNFDEWLLEISKNLSEKTIEENKVPSTIFLGVRKSDNKVIGTIQIRHKLNENLKEHFAVNITGQYRLIFRQKENNIIIEDLRKIREIEIMEVSKHYE